MLLSLRKRNPNHWVKTVKPCVVCGKEVELTAWGKYCSTACSSRAAYARKRLRLTLAEPRPVYGLEPPAPGAMEVLVGGGVMPYDSRTPFRR